MCCVNLNEVTDRHVNVTFLSVSEDLVSVVLGVSHDVNKVNKQLKKTTTTNVHQIQYCSLLTNSP